MTAAIGAPVLALSLIVWRMQERREAAPAPAGRL